MLGRKRYAQWDEMLGRMTYARWDDMLIGERYAWCEEPNFTEPSTLQ